MPLEKKRVGIFGGSFDPPHLGHLIIAQAALSELLLDKILFIPAASPPHKSARRLTEADQRYEMLKTAIDGHGRFEASRIELDRQGISYSIDTIRALLQKEEFVESSIYLIVGADNFLSFRSWREPDEILRLCTLVVYPRRGHQIKPESLKTIAPAIMLDAPQIEISSSHIRELARKKRSIKYLVPELTEKMIISSGLYRD